MPDDPTTTADQRDSILADLEAKSRSRSAYRATVTPQMAALANQGARYYPQVSQSYPGAVAAAAQTQDAGNVAAVGDAGTKEKNDSGDWWSPGDWISSATDTVESGLGAVGGAVSSAAQEVGSATYNYAVKPVVRGVTAAAQSGWEVAQNVYANRAPMSSDVAHMALGNTKADEQARQAYDAQLKRMGADDGLAGVYKPVTEPLRATTAGQVAIDVAHGEMPDMGTGFFPGGPVAEQQATAAREVRGVIPGTNQARTVGREVAATFTETGSTAYNIASGLVDAAAVIAFDPANKLHLHLGEAKDADKIANVDWEGVRNSVDDVEGWVANHPKAGAATIDDVRDAARDWRQAIEDRDLSKAQRAAYAVESIVNKVEPQAADDTARFSAGIIDGLRKTVHRPTTEQWLQGHEDVLQRFADDKSFTSIFNRLGRRVDPRIAVALKDAGTPEEVGTIFRQALGGEIPVGPATVYKGPMGEAVNRFDDWVKDHRTFRDMPGEEWITDTRGASSHELADSVQSMDDALANARTPRHLREQLVEDYARSLSGTSQDAFEAVKASLRAVEVQLAGRVPRSIAADLTRRIGEHADTIRSYAKDAMGNDSDHGLAKALSNLGLPGFEGLDGAAIVSPISLEQGVRRAVSAPDARVVRRLTAHPIMRALTTAVPKGADKLDAMAWGMPRAPLAFVDWTTTNLFRRLAVMRIAFIPRVVGEEMAYLGAAGGPSPFTHPLHFLSLAASKVKGDEVLAESFSRAPSGALPKELTDFQKAINVSTDLSDPAATRRLSMAKGDYATATKGVDRNRWIQGYSDQLAGAHTNPLKRMVADGSSTDDIMGYLRSAEGKGDYAELQGLLNRKGLAYRADGRTVRMPIDLTSDASLRTYIDTYVRGDVQRLAGDNPDLLQVISKGFIGAEERQVLNKDVAAVISRGVDPNTGDATWVGSRVRMRNGGVGVITDEFPAQGESMIQLGAPAWKERKASSALEKTLADWQDSDLSPSRMDVWTRPVERRAMTDGDVISRAMKVATRAFFGHLYGKTSDYLVRSPFYRQTYYDELEKMMPNLSKEGANEALKNLGKHGATDRQIDQMVSAAKTAGGNLDLEAADALAKGRALDVMHDTFYDWSRKSQFWDITRNIFPFGAAWKEMLGRYARLLKAEPVSTLRKAQLAVNGVQDSGFFHPDPQTGQEYFSFPLSGALAQIMTGGINAPMKASLQGLTLATSVIPGLGPFASLAVSHMLPDLPETNTLEQILFPYGRPKGENLGEVVTNILPSYLQNAASAIADKRNTTRLYGNTYVDVLRVKAASGDYDLSDQTQVAKLMDDAAHDARILAGMRAIAQFVSPSSPSYDYVVDTKHGDVLAAMLVDDLDAMRKDDPQNATRNFLDKYGDNAFIYLQGRTRATLGGLEMTTEFGDWQQQNPEAVKEHPDVAGYFAPAGSTFDFEVWRRQIAAGQREYLTDREIIDAAQATMGRWIYHQARQAAGAKPNDTQRLVLAKLRATLAKKYPGFDPSGDATPDKTALRVVELRSAVKNPDLVKTDAGQAISIYLGARDAVEKKAQAGGDVSFLQAKKYAPQRAILREIADKLIETHPEFERVWDSVFDREMAPDLEQP